MSDLDKDFEEAAAKINAKVKEAAAALAEANKLAGEAGLPGLIYTQWMRDDDDTKLTDEELDALEEDENWDGEDISHLERKMNMIDVSELESQIEGGGWSTSSSYC